MKSQFILKSTILYLIILGFCITLQPTPLLAVNTKPKAEKVEVSKLEKKIAKWNKKIEKWTASEEGLNDKPRPWIALGLAIVGLGSLILGFYASFGLNAVAAGIGIAVAGILSVISFKLAVNSFKRREETENSILTALTSSLAMIISGAILIILLLGAIAAISN